MFRAYFLAPGSQQLHVFPTPPHKKFLVTDWKFRPLLNGGLSRFGVAAVTVNWAIREWERINQPLASIFSHRIVISDFA